LRNDFLVRVFYNVPFTTKIHLHGIAKRNREDPCLNLNIDWVIDELGLGELKK
jgi:hypothetical protein